MYVYAYIQVFSYTFTVNALKKSFLRARIMYYIYLFKNHPLNLPYP